MTGNLGEGAVCSRHIEVPAVAACTRCGTFGCAACLGDPPGLCEECGQTDRSRRSLRAAFSRVDAEKTPGWLKAIVLLNALLLLRGIASSLEAALHGAAPAGISLGMSALAVATLLGLWRMRRWAVVGWSLLTILSSGIVFALGWGITSPVWILTLGLRLSLIAGGVALWQRMR